MFLRARTTLYQRIYMHINLHTACANFELFYLNCMGVCCIIHANVFRARYNGRDTGNYIAQMRVNAEYNESTVTRFY